MADTDALTIIRRALTDADRRRAAAQERARELAAELEQAVGRANVEAGAVAALEAVLADLAEAGAGAAPVPINRAGD